MVLVNYYLVITMKSFLKNIIIKVKFLMKKTFIYKKIKYNNYHRLLLILQYSISYQKYNL